MPVPSPKMSVNFVYDMLVDLLVLLIAQFMYLLMSYRFHLVLVCFPGCSLSTIQMY